MWTDAPTSPSLASTGSAKPLCRQRGPAPGLPGDISFPLSRCSRSLREPLPAAFTPADGRRLRDSGSLAGKRRHPTATAAAPGDAPYPVPAARTPRRVAPGTDRAPTGSRQGSQSSATDCGTRGTPQSTACPPASLQSLRYPANPIPSPGTDFLLVVPLT